MSYGIYDKGNKQSAISGNLFTEIINAFGGVTRQQANAQTVALQRENNAFNAEQSNLERSWQEAMYNKYSSPAAMVQQYKEAGLNPALMYENAASGPSFSGSAASAGSAPSLGSDTGGALAQLISLASVAAQIRNSSVQTNTASRLADADIQLKGAQARKANADAAGRETENKYIDALRELEIKRGNMDIEETLQNISYLSAMTETETYKQALLSSETILNRQKVSESEAKEALTKLQTALAECDLKTRDAFNRAYLDVYRAQAELMKAQQKLANAETSLKGAELEKVQQEVAAAEKEVEYLTETLEYRVKNTKHDIWRNDVKAASTAVTALVAGVGVALGVSKVKAPAAAAAPAYTPGRASNYGEPMN